MNNERYSNESVRDTIIIYGFFLVMLSAILSTSVQAVSLSLGIRLSLYIVSFFGGLAAALVGIGLLLMLKRIHLIAKAGLVVLASLVPAALVSYAGIILFHDTLEFANTGFIIFFIVFILITIILLVYEIKRKP